MQRAQVEPLVKKLRSHKPCHAVWPNKQIQLKNKNTSEFKHAKVKSAHDLAGFRKGRGTRDQIANICWIIEKAREFHKNIYFCFIDYAKAFDCVDHNKWCKILKEVGIPDHLTCLLRNLDAGQEATVRTGHGTKTGSKLGKEYVKVVYCHSAYLTYMQSIS